MHSVNVMLDGEAITLHGRVADLVGWLVRERDALTQHAKCQLQVDMGDSAVTPRLTVFYGPVTGAVPHRAKMPVIVE